MKPENLGFTMWSSAAFLTAAFNLFGGVALYFNPRRRVIFGSLAVSGLLLAIFLFVLI